MSFNPNASLDPSQVEDRRGGSGGGRGGPLMIGGGGLGVVVLIVSLLLGVNPGDLLGGNGTTSGYEQAAPAGAQSTGQGVQECRTGADANQRDDCRIVGFVNS